MSQTDPPETGLPPAAATRYAAPLQPDAYAAAAAQPGSASGPAPGPAPTVEVSLLDILLVLSRRRRFLALVTLAFTVIGLIIACILKPSYTATTVILPPQQSSSTSSALMSELGSLGSLGSLAGGSLGIKNPGDMYVALFKSDTVENAVIQQFHLQALYHEKYLSVTRKDLENKSKILSDTKTSLISISFTDHDAHRAAAVANGIVDQYRRLSEHLAITEAGQRRLFFQQQLLDAKNNLSQAEDALVRTEQKTGLVSLDSQSRTLIESAASLRAQIAAKQVQIQGIQSYASTSNAALTQAQNELAGLQAQLAKLQGSASMDNEGLIVPKGPVSEATLAYVRAVRDVKYNETIFNILARQFEVAKLDEAREGSLVQVVDPAQVPDYKSGPKRALWTVGAFLLGLFLSSGIVLWQAALRLLRRDPETAQKLHALRSSLPGKSHPAGN